MGRNQYILDLTRQEVRDYIVEAVSNILVSANIEYVKWDMNRNISDAYSGPLGKNQGEFYHRYMLGLYEIMDRITKAFPHILFEGCAAGGNRFDLGILYYMPQIWTSDDTDADQRTHIQKGTSYGYPLSTMTAHVSTVPNHQTLRTSPLETRFHIACYGVLGYEMDITKITRAEKKVISEQIEFYKKHRRLFQFGIFSRLPSDDNHVIWQVVSEDKHEAIVLFYQRLAVPVARQDILKLSGLLPDTLYEVKVRKQYLSTTQSDSANADSLEDDMQVNEIEEYQVFGDLLMNAGIKLSQQFVGIGYNEKTRIMGDFSSRLYEIRAVNKFMKN